MTMDGKNKIPRLKNRANEADQNCKDQSEAIKGKQKHTFLDLLRKSSKILVIRLDKHFRKLT